MAAIQGTSELWKGVEIGLAIGAITGGVNSLSKADGISGNTLYYYEPCTLITKTYIGEWREKGAFTEADYMAMLQAMADDCGYTAENEVNEDGNNHFKLIHPDGLMTDIPWHKNYYGYPNLGYAHLQDGDTAIYEYNPNLPLETKTEDGTTYKRIKFDYSYYDNEKKFLYSPVTNGIEKITSDLYCYGGGRDNYRHTSDLTKDASIACTCPRQKFNLFNSGVKGFAGFANCNDSLKDFLCISDVIVNTEYKEPEIKPCVLYITTDIYNFVFKLVDILTLQQYIVKPISNFGLVILETLEEPYKN